MKLLCALAGSALLVLAASPTLAQQSEPSQPPLGVQSVLGGGGRAPASPEMQAARQAMRASCAADMSTLCADTAPPADGAARGEAMRARMQCLRTHAAELSSPCRQALVAMRDARKNAKT